VCRKYRRALRLNAYYYFVDHQERAGGCVSYRLAGREKANIETLRKKWGGSIVKVREGTINPLVKIPIPGI
jgi:hypothetical protein